MLLAKIFIKSIEQRGKNLDGEDYCDTFHQFLELEKIDDTYLLYLRIYGGGAMFNQKRLHMSDFEMPITKHRKKKK